MTEDWKKRIKDLEAMHDAQRKDLEEKLDEARANLLHAEKIVKALQPDPARDCYTLSRLWLLAQNPLVLRYFETVL